MFRNGYVLARPRSRASLSQRGECPSFVCLLGARGLLLMSCPLNTSSGCSRKCASAEGSERPQTVCRCDSTTAMQTWKVPKNFHSAASSALLGVSGHKSAGPQKCLRCTTAQPAATGSSAVLKWRRDSQLHAEPTLPLTLQRKRRIPNNLTRLNAPSIYFVDRYLCS